MSLESNNKTIVQEYFDRYWAKGDSSVVDELCTDDFLISYPNHGPRHGKKAAKAMIDEFREAIPDLTFRPFGPPLIAEGDYVAARWIGGGTHSGRAFDDLNTGTLSQPNTGKKIWFSGITIFTLKNGKIKEEVAEEDGLQVLQQLGLVPGPNPGKEKKYDSNGDQIY